MSYKMDPDFNIVELDSDEKSEEEATRPSLKRTAKKSTTAEVTKNTLAVTTRRQVALATAAHNKKNQPADRFLENFDPESSARERRKLTRKFHSITLSARKIPGAVYDENGVHLETGIDLCDCLNTTCVGCHFPCPKCKSLKCGPECRNNRKYIYDQIEFHGCDLIVKNPFVK